MITPTAREGGYLPVAAYGLIGDGRSAALVASDGSIDWLCLPRFDDPSLFGRLLDARRGGHWQLAPRGPYRVLQRYGDRSNVLETVFETRTGRVLLSDLMPLAAGPTDPQVVRIVECLSGEMTLRHECLPAPGYAEQGPVAPGFDGGVLRIAGGGDDVLVTGSEPIVRGREELHLLAGETVAFGLHVCAGAAAPPSWSTARAQRLRGETGAAWWAWVARCAYAGPHPEAVARSALVLGLLTHAPTGAMLAAATTSLPEPGGGGGTRDLRAVSMEDASTAPAVFLQLGLLDEAHALSGWLERHPGGGAEGLVPLDGARAGGERALDHLDGHRGTGPVRVGASDGDTAAGLAAAFRRVGALARHGDLDQAERLFARLLTHRSPLGLLSGDVDARTGELLGNFPRAAAHLALVGAAVDIERARAGTAGSQGGGG
ncbi:MAG TPA: trehalase-like domain-containing protein [Candidatus Dormibacteraeota bacterium]